MAALVPHAEGAEEDLVGQREDFHRLHWAGDTRVLSLPSARAELQELG